MDKELIYSQMEMSTQGNIRMESLMEKDNTHGEMALFMWESLKMDLNMERGNGEVVKVLNAIHMRAIMLLIRSMAMEYSTGQVEIYTRENIKKMKEMGMVKCVGLMEVYIKENGLEGSNMEWVKWSFQVEI
jgi:hypothetical protein